MASCCNGKVIFVPAFYDFKCPRCGKPVDMTDKEKYDNQQLCDMTMDLAKKMNEKVKKK